MESKVEESKTPLEKSLDSLAVSVDNSMAVLDRVREQRNLAISRLKHILKQTGVPDECESCGARIHQLRHLNGIAIPYNADGSLHIPTCGVKAEANRA